MKFRNLSQVFDDLDTYDGYSGRYLFRSQQAAFETAQPEGSLAKRRVLSAAPNIVMPARRCVRILDEYWIVGGQSIDGLFNRALRASYWTRKGTDLPTVRTPGQAALGAGGTAAYCMREYFKDTVDGLSTSDYFTQYLVSFSTSEMIARGSYLALGSRLMRVRSTNDDSAGFTAAFVDDLGSDALHTATFTTTTYLPATDTSTVVSTAVPGILIERARLYSQSTAADELYHQGDHTLVVAKSSITPTPGQELTVQSLNWRVEQVASEQDAWALHVRRR